MKIFRWYYLVPIILVSVITWWVWSNFFITSFTPVDLTKQEEVLLEEKIDRLSDPDAYTEVGASRAVSFSEREINELFVNSQGLGERAFINLSDGLVSLRLLVEVPADFPVAAGRTIKLNAGLEVGYAAGRPVVSLKGVSVGGVPVPNAWLGEMKGVNLLEGREAGFLERGIEDISVKSGKLELLLKE